MERNDHTCTGNASVPVTPRSFANAQNELAGWYETIMKVVLQVIERCRRPS